MGASVLFCSGDCSLEGFDASRDLGTAIGERGKRGLARQESLLRHKLSLKFCKAQFRVLFLLWPGDTVRAHTRASVKVSDSGCGSDMCMCVCVCVCFVNRENRATTVSRLQLRELQCRVT